MAETCRRQYNEVGYNSEVCHPRCVFKLHGEVNSVKNTTVNVRLNDGVYWQWKKLHVSAYGGYHQDLTTLFDNFLQPPH